MVLCGVKDDKRILTSPAQLANVSFVLTGQGAQWHAIGAELFEYHVFQATIRYLDYVLEALRTTPSWTIEAINSPSSITLSGEADVIEELLEVLSRDGMFDRPLKTGGNAYRSHHMIPLGFDYVNMLTRGLERVKQLKLSDGRHRYPPIPWASSVT
ncbi:hypothetical protein AJ80_00743 [Polytolypa hystricis UAMH7299]|uniref:Uncharacterized protein n=1 Tax=Polytolypa hystricis (strain UAMH7299) TaxID=1447883 RepID=A0A2B7Z370_POLH7|nr:hypothetical protein AJ80_00743 [Polytolypa hystricis UAMH7299]